MFGMPLYPGGWPVNQENCRYDDHTPRELFHLFKEGKANSVQTNMLKEWIKYHVKAPIFRNGIEGQGESVKSLDGKTVDEMIEWCLSVGLDPL